MPAWLDRLTRRHRSHPDAVLAQRLHGYPPFTAPHVGPPSRWTLEQAQQNLAYLLEHREQRLTLLGELLADEGIDIWPALGGGDVKPLLDTLHRWAAQRWPALHDRAIASDKVWLRSTRSGDQRVYSMLMDVAILLGELIVRRCPAFRWDLDLDEVNGRDGMTSYMRPVVQMARRGAMPAPIVIDVEDIVVGRYIHPEDAAHRLSNEWARVVDQAVSGALEAPWQSDPAPR